MKSITTDEVKWLNARFPDLKVNGSSNELSITGKLIIDMYYNEGSKNEYIIFPEGDICSTPQYINDDYQVEIEYQDSLFVPRVYETAGRIKAFAEKKRMELADLHVYPKQGNLCLCPRSIERIRLNGQYTIEDFFKVLVIPFFYAQSYYERFSKWPWKDYSHDDIGILECYADYRSSVQDKESFIEHTIMALSSKNQSIVRSADQITRQSLCFCNSGKKFRHCHHDVWSIAKLLKGDSLN